MGLVKHCRKIASQDDTFETSSIRCRGYGREAGGLGVRHVDTELS